ncbi:MAG: sugar phosphate nucleotidyltransferase, partial [bacterium]|nr:sugar phosphate nucleotidyltransferase [bacterium]
MKDTVALILAGGTGSRLNVLVKDRAKPAVPFGGNYRIIDFTMSNVMYSNVSRVGIITQYQNSSISEYIHKGEAWNFSSNSHLLKLLPSLKSTENLINYSGTADAVSKNFNFVKQFN